MSTLSRPLYRGRQFFSSLRPRLVDRERQEAAEVLGNGLMPLFDSMSRRDQRHCFDVYASLLGTGCEDRDVLAAALLHDAGKGRLAGATVRLWHRVAYVLLAATTPAALARLGTGGGLGVLRRHAERGAELAAQRGASPAVVELIRRHEERDDPDEQLRRLRAADDAC